MSATVRWVAVMVLRIALIIAVALAILFAWKQGTPWAMIVFAIFVLSLLGAEAVFTERRKLGSRNPEGSIDHQRRSSDSTPAERDVQAPRGLRRHRPADS